MATRLAHAVGDLILGRLEVLGRLGAGAHGTVYLCRDEAGQRYAVKELHVCDDELAVAQALSYFRAEAEVLAHLSHPAIPTATPVDLEGPFRIDPETGLESPTGSLIIPARRYLVMDHVEGRSLEELVAGRSAEDGPLPTEKVMPWLRQIGLALALVHERGLVHRDVKPANILIAADGDQAWLIDFGLCRPCRAVPGYGTVPLSESGRMGTPGYAPPDPIEQENPVPASDQHALAMCALRALTGLDPTRPEALAELRGRRVAELRGGLEPHLALALERAIRPAAEDRYPSLMAFLAALEAPPAPFARPPRQTWVELEPKTLDLGPVAPGTIRDITVVVRDRRPGLKPRGQAESEDDRLRILPPTAHGTEIILHLVLKVPRRAGPGPVRTRLIVQANDEEHLLPVLYTVDPDLPPPRLGQTGCLLGLVGWWAGGRG